MALLRILLAAAALACAAAGCGVGPGEAAEGEAHLAVTVDFGAETVLEAHSENPDASETVVRFLDREAEIETAYGGNFVTSIEGMGGGGGEGGREDWFFYVNGYWSPVGAGEARVRPGDRIWWDRRSWEDAYRVPAVVGSWPEPFLHGFDGERLGVEVDCRADPTACDEVVAILADHGIEAGLVRRSGGLETAGAGGAAPQAPDPESLRILVGPWAELRDDPAARQLERGPGHSGVYAEPGRCRGGWRLVVLGPDAAPRRSLEDAGFVAAVRRGEEQPTWIVAATRRDGVDDAVALLDEGALRHRYAVAVAAGEGGAEPIPLPAAAGEPMIEGDC